MKARQADHLRHMGFDPEVRKVLKERSQLHKILENEVWVFGERFNLLVSDRSLDTVLDRHLDQLGRTERNPSPVRRLDGRTGIVDLTLSRARKEHDRHQHLVVELKAPSIDHAMEHLSARHNGRVPGILVPGRRPGPTPNRAATT
jgi:hypothetical protein